jgi:hypothetical protein
MTFTTNDSYVIGDTYQGGIIFYVIGTYPNQHGLVCAPTNQSTGIKWWNGSYESISATGSAVGTGQANTTAIVAALGDGSYAAKLCDDLDLNGYSDWFLPSLDELELMYTNLKVNNIGGFNSVRYWSSYNDGFYHDAWVFDFNYGHILYVMGENTTNYVRAVRAF